MFASQSYHKNVVRFLEFGSDSDAKEKRHTKLINGSQRGKIKKRKLVEESLHNYCYSKKSCVDPHKSPEKPLADHNIVQTAFLELRTVLHEKRKYLEQIFTGAKEAHNEEINKFLVFCGDDSRKSQEVYNNIKNIKDMFILTCKDSKTNGEELLSSIRKLLEAAKNQQTNLMDTFHSLKTIHNDYLKDVNTYEDDFKTCSSTLQRNLSRDLKNIQKKLTQKMQKETLADMKKNLKSIYLNCVEEAKDCRSKLEYSNLDEFSGEPTLGNQLM